MTSEGICDNQSRLFYLSLLVVQVSLLFSSLQIQHPSLSDNLLPLSTSYFQLKKPHTPFPLQLSSRSLSLLYHPSLTTQLSNLSCNHLIQLTAAEVTGRNNSKRMSKNCRPVNKVKSPWKNGKEAVGLIIKSSLI